MTPGGGLFDPQLMALFQELTAALIQYTPGHFKLIHATIRPGGGEELSYEIGCPQFPDEGTNKVNARVQAAAMNLVRYWTRDGAIFPGVLVVLTQQPDGTWKNSIKNLEYAEKERGTPKSEPEEDTPSPPAKPWWKFW
jgi:hypothetical protein